MCLILGYFLCLIVDGLWIGIVFIFIYLCSMINFIFYEYYVIVYLVVNYSIINCDLRDLKIDVGIMICLNCSR